MLEVHISGQARLAAVVDGESLLCLEAGRDAAEARSRLEFDYLFADVGDLRVERCNNWQEASRKLNTAIRQDDALALLLIVLDGNACTDARRDAVGLIEESLADLEVSDFLIRRMTAAPLPISADLDGSIAFARSEKAAGLVELLSRVCVAQRMVEHVCSSWQALPEESFLSLPDRASLRRSLRDLGVFYHLVKRDRNAVLAAIKDWPANQRRGLNALLQQWYSDVCDRYTRQEMIFPSLADVSPDPGEARLGKAIRGLYLSSHYISLRGVVALLCEALLLLAAPLMAARIRFWAEAGRFENYTDSTESIFRCWVFAIVFLASFYWNGLYDLRKPGRLANIFGLTQALGIACLILGASYYLIPSLLFGRGVFFIALGVVLLAVVCTRILGATFWRMAMPTENTIILGTHSMAVDVAQALHERHDLTTRLVGFVEEERNKQGTATLLGYPVLGTLDDLEAIVASRQIRRIVVAIDERQGVLPIGQLIRLEMDGICVEQAQSVITALTGRVRLETLPPSWHVFSDAFRQSKFTLLAKRIVDLLFGIIGLLISLPIIALTAIAIKLDSKGPILYRQQRVGYKGHCFDVLKFRSMRMDAEVNGAQFSTADDPRITRVGRFIRRFRLDEFPQFINVIRGEVSFVGPRPERPVFVEELRERTAYYDQRHSVRPGLTGWAQVQYRYGSSIDDAYVKLEYDLFYLQNMSIPFDLAIIFKAILLALTTGREALPFAPSGASVPGPPNASTSSAQVGRPSRS